MKKLLYVFLAVTVVFAMVACGNGSTDKPKVEKVTVDTVPAGITTVEQGKTLTFAAKVEGTNGPAQTVTWEVTGGGEGTAITAAGVLTAAEAEAVGTKLTVTATSTVDKGKKGSLEVTVVEVGAITVDTVTVTPATADVGNGRLQQFTAAVAGTGDPAQTVTWSVVSDKTGSKSKISDAGLLLVDGKEEIGAKLTVTATSTVDATKSGTATVTVIENTEIVALENGTYPIFKFELPEGRQFDDYIKISAEFQLVYPENAAGEGQPGAVQLRSVRLLGSYKETDFITSDGGVPLNAHVAKYDEKNAPFIAVNASGYSWSYTAFPGFDPLKPGDWFAGEMNLDPTYSKDGDAGNGGSFDNGNWPDVDATGPFFFGIGLTGNVGTHVVQRIKNVRLVGADDTIDDLYSVGSGFADGLPAFAGYSPFPKENSVYRGTTIPAIIRFNWHGHGEKPRATVVPVGSTFGTLLTDLAAVSLDITVDQPGWFFEGWFLDAGYTQPVAAGTTFAEGLTILHAKWEEDLDYVPNPSVPHPYSTATTDTVVVLGAPTWIGGTSATQRGWNTYDAKDASDVALTIGQFTWARYIVIEADSFNSLEFVWHNNSIGNGWVGSTKLFADSTTDTDWLAGSTAVPGSVVVIENPDTTPGAGAYIATVELSKALDNNYAGFIATTPDAGDWVGLLFQNADWANDVKSVKLIIPPPPAP